MRTLSIQFTPGSNQVVVVKGITSQADALDAQIQELKDLISRELEEVALELGRS